MKRFIGSLDMLIAVVFVALALVALSGVPTAFYGRAAEPEDFYGLLFLFVAMVTAGIASALVGLALIRERVFLGVSRGKSSHLSAWLAVLLLLVSILGFWPNDHDPVAKELRLFLLPAAVFGASFLLLRKNRGQRTIS